MTDREQAESATRERGGASAWLPEPGSAWTAAELEAVARAGVPVVRVDQRTGQPVEQRPGADADEVSAPAPVTVWEPEPGAGWSVADLEALERAGAPVVQVDPDSRVPLAPGGADAEPERQREALMATGSWIDDCPRRGAGPASWFAQRDPSGECLRDLEALPEDLSSDAYEAVELVAAWNRLEAYCAAGKRRAAAAMARQELLSQGLAHLAQMGIRTSEVSIAGDELSVRLGISKPAVTKLAKSGRLMDQVGIPTGDALTEGHIDAVKADLILDAIDGLGHHAALAVQERVLPKAPHLTAGQLRKEIAAACAAVDPDQFEDRCARAAQGRRVGRPRALPDGMASIYAVMPAVETTQLYRAVDVAARSAKSAGDERTMDQLRADALALMGYAAIASGSIGATSQPHLDHASQADQPRTVGHQISDHPDCRGDAENCRGDAGDGRADAENCRGDVENYMSDAEDCRAEAEPSGEPHMRVGHIGGATAHVRVTVPYTVLMDDPPPGSTPWQAGDKPTDNPAEPRPADGSPGPHPPPGGLPSREPVPDQFAIPILEGYGPIAAGVARALAAGSAWSRLVLDPIDRTVLEASTAKYRPPESMARLVRAAQPQCAGLTCTVSSDSCDLNHRIPYPVGATSVWNLDPGCRRDHLLITHGGWSYEADEVGSRIWTTATGHVYLQRLNGEVTMLSSSPDHLDDDAPPPF